MSIGRFIGGVAALIWSPATDRYLLLKRSEGKDFARGIWECVTGRLEQGEGFEDALLREVQEEVGVAVEIEYFLGTTHFYRGEQKPENELVGIVCCCSVEDPQGIRLGEEHSEYRWLSAREVDELLDGSDASTRWIRRVVMRAEMLKNLVPPEQRSFFRQQGIELG